MTLLEALRVELDDSFEELLAQIEALTEANRLAPDRNRERRLRALRHLAGIRLLDDAPHDPQFVDPEPGRLPADAPPEIAAEWLSAPLLRAAILRDGCVLVRGLLERGRALALARDIDQAYEQRLRQKTGKRTEPGYFEQFEPHPRFGPVHGRPWIERGGGLLAADSPLILFAVMEAFERLNLRSLVSDYLGEPALISVHKTTLRKAEPSVAGAWHQDGYFMGEVRSLNLWLSLSRCGDEAPGLDILPRRLDYYLATNTDGSPLDYTISDLKVQAAGGGDATVIRPIFEPGDALVFDEVFLHKTGSDPSMPNPRYAIESWFFGGSRFPGEYAPLAI